MEGGLERDDVIGKRDICIVVMSLEQEKLIYWVVE